MIRKSLRPLNDSTNTHKPAPIYKNTSRITPKRISSKNSRSNTSSITQTTPKFSTKLQPQTNKFLHNSNLSKLKEKPTLSQFEIGKTLGRGKLGRVYCARHKPLGLICAIKVMSLSQLKSLRLETNLQREIEIQASINHPNILKLYTYFSDSKNVYLVIEYTIYGELYHHLKKERRFTNTRASQYTYQIASALSFLHSNGIIHRDLKPENILVDFNHNLKLSDFGWSINANNVKRSTMCGTLDYLSPEMVTGQPYDHRSDVWSLGVLIYEFLVGTPPFEADDKNVTYKRIARLDIKFPDYIDPDAKNLILSLLKLDDSKRFSLDSIASHPWIIKNKSKWPK